MNGVPDNAVERVKGIEPAQSALEGWGWKRHVGCSALSQANVVPSAWLSATHGGRKSGSSLTLGLLFR